MKICKDGRIWGQNNREAGSHLGILIIRRGQCKTETRSESKKGSKNPMFGTKTDNSGERNPNWKGGITPLSFKIRNSIESQLWRGAVFARDNWTCQDCGARCGNGKAVKLYAHHIKSFARYPELRFAIDNGQTLCRVCHKLTPNFKGKGHK